MTNKIIELFSNAGLINSENDQIVLLGVRRICGALTDLCIAAFWSLIFGDIFVGILFEICYSILRIYAGGYHASSAKVCKWLTYISTLISILMVFMVNVKGSILHSLLMFSICLIGVNAPVENENKPLSKTEKKVYKRKCIIISLGEIGLYIFFTVMGLTVYARTVCVAIILVAMGVIFGKRNDKCIK